MRRNPTGSAFEALFRISQKSNYYRNRNNTRRLTDEDYDTFDKAATRRGNTPITTRDTIAKIKADNPVRWWRLKRDVRWAQRLLVKMGRNPSDLWSLLNE